MNRLKKIGKILGITLLSLVCVTVLVYVGAMFWTVMPRAHKEPPVLNVEKIFPEEAPLTWEEEAPSEEASPESLELPQEGTEATPEEQPEEQTDEPVEEQPETLSLGAPLDLKPYREQAQAILDTMSTEEKLYQLMIVTPEALTDQGTVTQAGPTTQASLERRPVGGVCYFAPNLVDGEQTKAMLTGIQSFSKIPLFLAVDEEGGTVSRAGANQAMGVPHLEAAANYGQRADSQEVFAAGETLGAALAGLGFNVDFAPVADVVTNPNNTEIGNRAYSNDPQVAGPLVAAMTAGLQEGGVGACLKHFPGHGSTEGDSHKTAVSSSRTLEQLREAEWVPFRQGIGAGATFVMVGHQTNANLSKLPASLSPVVMTYLRQELAFPGLIITDSLRMGAIIDGYTSAQAAVMAISAGADMLLMPNDLDTALQGLQAALEDGTLTQARIDESVLRILSVKLHLGLFPQEEAAEPTQG